MIAYFKGKSFVSKLIKWRTWGKYSHVAWIVEKDVTFVHPDYGRMFIPAGTIYESWHRKGKGAKRSGVRKGRAGDLHKPGTPIDLTSIELNDHQYAQLLIALEFWARHPDASYAFRAVISGFMLRKKINSPKKQFCSELLMRSFNKVPDFLFLREILPEQTSPEEMSHSPIQKEVGTWETGTDWPRFKLEGNWR